jgi:pantoate--beta-alanine ligase
MIVVSTVAGMAGTAYSDGLTGLVPTMGCLHEGHLSLMRDAREGCANVVVSIFVNPTQFGPSEDLDKYPRDMDGDLEKCEQAGVDIVFAPEPHDMYPGGYDTYVDVGDRYAHALCGRTRPGHFRGVATVVTKLFNIIRPDRAYFGMKDFQQTVVIRRFTSDLNLPVEIVTCPTVREPDGLAMSSRNAYLNVDERMAATALFRGLTEARDMFLSGETDPENLEYVADKAMSSEPLVEPEYSELVEPDTLKPALAACRGMALAVAARVGRTRLIDNIVL